MRSRRFSRWHGGSWMLLLAVLAAAPPAIAFDLRHGQRWGSEEGLPHNSVYALAEDADGFVWIGTPDGLARFDGAEFRVYRSDATATGSLRHSVVRSLVAGADGALWVGTDAGLDRLPRGEERFERVELGAAPRVVRALAEDALGELWIGTDEGLYRLADGLSRAKRVALDVDLGAGEVLGIAARPTGGVWVLSGDANGGNAVVHALGADGAAERSAPLPASGGASVLLHDGSRERLWLAPGVELEASSLAARIQAVAVAPIPQAAVLSPAGELFVGGDRGLFRGCEPEASLVDVTRVLGADDWLGRYVRALLVDRGGGLWVGTYAGVVRFDPHARPFVALQADPADPSALPAPAVSSFAETASGIWIATLGGGIARLGADGRVAERIGGLSALPSDVVWHLEAAPDGALWVATEAGLARLDPGARRAETVWPADGDGPSPPPRLVHLAWETPRRLWLASHDGLFTIDPSTRAVERVELGGGPSGPNRHHVDALLLDRRRGCLWAGTRGGVARVDLERLAVTRIELVGEDGAPLVSEGLFHLALARDGALWIGSGAGLTRLDPDRGEQRHYRTRDGLPGSVVYSVVEDGSGVLWLGTNRGIARFDPVAETWRRYDRGDGLASFEQNRHAALRLASGELLFGGVSGLTRFRPEAVAAHPYPPPVRFTAIECFGPDGVRRENPQRAAEVVLTPRDDGVAVRFAALAYFRPERNRFRYRLVGFDRDWIDAGDRGEARYSRLPPGRYRFEAMAANADGVWSREPATLAVRVRPPLHRTTLFRLAVAVAVALMLAFAYRLRVAHLVALERLRVSVASDLHDELSSNLAGIAVAAELAAAKCEPGVRERLGEIRGAALAMVEAVRDTVWAIDPEQDSAAALGRRLRQAARALLGELPVAIEIDAPDELVLGMETRRNLYLAAKELLHNVARHAAATRAELRFAVDDRGFRLVVVDDGRGFDPAAVAGGTGLASLRRRARRLGARLVVDSAPGRGTRVELAGEVARTRDRRGRGTRRSLGATRPPGGSP